MDVSLTLHRSPDEKDAVINAINIVSNRLNDLIYDRWNVTFNVPLLLEGKIGPNWLNTVDI